MIKMLRDRFGGNRKINVRTTLSTGTTGGYYNKRKHRQTTRIKLEKGGFDNSRGRFHFLNFMVFYAQLKTSGVKKQ